MNNTTTQLGMKLGMRAACAGLSDSIVGMKISENTTRTTGKGGGSGGTPAPARVSRFFLLNDFPPLSRSLEQVRMRSITHAAQRKEN